MTYDICSFGEVRDQTIDGNRTLGFELHPEEFKVILGVQLEAGRRTLKLGNSPMLSGKTRTYSGHESISTVTSRKGYTPSTSA